MINANCDALNVEPFHSAARPLLPSAIREILEREIREEDGEATTLVDSLAGL